MRITKLQEIEKDKLFAKGLKKCHKCDKPKPISEFGKHKNTKYGLTVYCKEHIKESRDENKEEILAKQKEYYINNPWMQSYRGLRERCEYPKHISYKWYGERGIKCYLTKAEIKFLWFRDKAYLMNKPSIDRRENDDHYTLENCRFIELIENIAKDSRKPVLQSDLKGNFIREWVSASEAGRKIGVDQSSINRCCNNKRKTAGGYKWRYKDVKQYSL